MRDLNLVDISIDEFDGLARAFDGYGLDSSALRGEIDFVSIEPPIGGLQISLQLSIYPKNPKVLDGDTAEVVVIELGFVGVTKLTISESNSGAPAELRIMATSTEDKKQCVAGWSGDLEMTGSLDMSFDFESVNLRRSKRGQVWLIDT